MKWIRIKTGACPICGSLVTARIKKDSSFRVAYHFGSPVVYMPNSGEYNRMCLNCGVQWIGYDELETVEMDEMKPLREEYLKIEEYIIDEIPTKWEERQILQEISEDMGITAPKGQKKRNPIISLTGRTVKNTLLSPFRAVKSVFSDLGDIARESPLNDRKTEEDEEKEEDA